MTTNPEFDRLASSWLAAGPTELNDRVLEAALREIRLTNQRRRMTVPWRTSTLNNPQRLAAAIAIVAIAGVAGLNLFRGNGVGGPTTAPTTAPTPSPTTSAATPSPATTSSAFRPFPPAAGPLAAGAYRAGGPFVLPDLTFDVPAGWNAWTGVQNGVISMEIDSPTNAGSTGAFVNFEVAGAVYADPCKTGTTVTIPDLGPTVDDFVAAVSKLPKFTVGPVTDRVVGGLPGKQFDLTNSIPGDGTGCPGVSGLVHVWSTGDVGGDTLGGLRQHVVVVDVRGTRLVIEVLYTDPDMAVDDDVNAIIDSIRFE